jgi:hypothetical protein
LFHVLLQKTDGDEKLINQLFVNQCGSHFPESFHSFYEHNLSFAINPDPDKQTGQIGLQSSI